MYDVFHGVIGPIGNPEPPDEKESPLDDVDWDGEPIDFSKPEVYAEWKGKLEKYYSRCDVDHLVQVYGGSKDDYFEPVRHVAMKTGHFYILPKSPRIVRNGCRFVDNVNLDDYDEDVTWKDIVEELKEKTEEWYYNQEPDPDEERDRREDR